MMPSTQARPRLHHFDVIKGIAIFMVVMGHVITFCIRDLDRATIFKVISQTHMPLFFFISGWFTYGLATNGTLRAPKLVHRFRQLIIPMVAVSTLWIYYFPHSGLRSPFDSTWSGLWLEVGKNGYWFPLCLFEIILIYAAIRPLLQRLRGFIGGVVVGGLIWAVLLWLNILGGHSFPVVNAALGLTLLSLYWPAFFIGFMASRHRAGFDRIVANPVTIGTSLIIGGFALYFLCWYWEFGLSDKVCILIYQVAAAIYSFSLVTITIAVIRPWTDTAYADPQRKPGRWIRIWTYLGVNSLGIYLLHYFFLFPMTEWQGILESMNVAFAPMFVVSVFWAAIITILTLGVIRLLRPCPPLAMLLTGTKS